MTTRIEYVRFVSKRGTVDGFPSTQSERRHILYISCDKHHNFRHGQDLLNQI